MRWAEVDGLEMARYQDEFSKKAACKPSLLFLPSRDAFGSNASQERLCYELMSWHMARRCGLGGTQGFLYIGGPASSSSLL
jgi:hypothetical protein